MRLGEICRRQGRAIMVTVAMATMVVPLLGNPAGAAPVCNTTPITFTPPPGPTFDVQRLLPHPSPITFSGLSGTISDVNVSLKGLSYPWMSDLDVLLVAPDGKNLIVMSDIGGTPDVANTVSNIDLTFDDQAASFATFNGQLNSGSYKPTNDNTDPNEFLPSHVDTFSSVSGPPNPQFTGPTPSSATAFSTFNGSGANGDWKLYVIDDDPGPPTAGSFAGGWCIDITTAAPPRKPVADFDGDGKTDASVFRPSASTWYVHGSAGTDTATNFGTAGDIQVAGDYNGNGTTDVAVFRPSTGTWYVQGGPTVAWGTSGDIPVPGDYNNDGTTDVAVFRPSTGTWYVQGGPTVAWGTSGDIPVPGDYNNDGTTDVAVFRPSTGTWYVQGGLTIAWGTTGDNPVPLPSAIRQPFFP